MKQMILATWDENKLREVQRLAPPNVEIRGLKDFPEAQKHTPKTDKRTFLESAYYLANYWAERLPYPVLAEVDGLTLDALNGFPGVKSKKFIQEISNNSVNTDDASEFYPFLLALIEKSKTQSTVAHWVAAMSYVDIQHRITLSYVNALHGNMCECKGENEFGFDQYFLVKGFYNKTLSEMSSMQKDSISPRSKCLKTIMNQI